MKKKFKKLIYSAYANSNKNLSKFKDRHQGEECYVIGDGASLKWFDLDVFNDKPVFPLCFLFLHRHFCDIGSPLYVPMSTPFYFYPYTRLPPQLRSSHLAHLFWKNDIQRRYRQFIKQRADIEFFLNLSNYPVLRGPNVNYLFQSIPGFEFIKACLAKNIDPFAGGFTAAISLIILMGFSKAYLVGCDYTHKKAHIKHWYEFGPGEPIEPKAYHEDFFEIATQYIDIITMTLEGEGSYLPSIEYEKYANKPPLYSENVDLIEKSDLLVLDTWPGYDIFPNQ